MEVPLKEHLLALMEEQFGAQEKAVQAALAAQKELTASAFAASEKAITKAEEAQKSYNQTHNDLSRKMDEQYKEMMPRSESLARHASNELRYQELKDDFSKLRGEVKDGLSQLRIELMKEIGGLRESRSEGTGEKGGRLSQQQFVVMIVGLVASLLLIGGVVVSIAFAVRR
jgi:chromosome segregation ATPase